MVQIEWRLRSFDERSIQKLSTEAKVHPLIAQLLIQRGILDRASVNRYLEVRRDGLHEPALLPGLLDAASLITQAIRDRRKIIVYGDYDVDGVCGTSLLWECLKLAGANAAEYYIPHRQEEGYGLNAGALERIADAHPGCVLVTVDCGVTAVAEAQLARSLGIDLIITDHHTPGDAWPDAAAVVHPRAPGGLYPFPDLCGAGVAFKLAWQIAKGLGDGQRASPQLRNYLIQAMNLVALATVADVVPLEDENRIFVRHGLRGLAVEPSVGLRALMQVSGCADKKSLSTGTIGFSLAPRINAAGRMERALAAVELLTTNDDLRAADLAQSLDLYNADRQKVEREIVAQAHAMIHDQGGIGDRGAIVLGHPSWHPGVVGIVASRMVDAYHRPTVVIAIDGELGQGSCRSVPGFDVHAALSACSVHLTKFGGHKAAAGLKIHSQSIDSFAAQFDDYCRSTLTEEQRTKVLRIDAQVPLSLLTHQIVEAIDSLEPFGASNPKPVLMSEPVRVVGEPRWVGEGGAHVQVRFEQGSKVVSAIGFNMSKKLSGLTAGAACAIAYFPTIDTWNGRNTLKLELKDVRILEP